MPAPEHADAVTMETPRHIEGETKTESRDKRIRARKLEAIRGGDVAKKES